MLLLTSYTPPPQQALLAWTTLLCSHPRAVVEVRPTRTVSCARWGIRRRSPCQRCLSTLQPRVVGENCTPTVSLTTLSSRPPRLISGQVRRCRRPLHAGRGRTGCISRRRPPQLCFNAPQPGDVVDEAGKGHQVFVRKCPPGRHWFKSR